MTNTSPVDPAGLLRAPVAADRLVAPGGSEIVVDPRSRGDGRVGEPAHQRIYQLDALRGILAMGVVVYHVWPGAPIALGTWGVYAFFVLSGWAMEHVYGGRLNVRTFVVARIARLAPLWIPVVLVSAITHNTSPAMLVLNLTGAFGVAPGVASRVAGGWSIGIEVACYAAFVLLALRRLPTWFLAALTVATLALRAWWNGDFMALPTVEDWPYYTLLPSFIGFFVAGMLCARLVRLPEWSGRRARVSTILGDLSYGTYLIHPIVAIVLGPWTLLASPLLALAIHPAELRAGRWIRRSVHLHQHPDRLIPPAVVAPAHEFPAQPSR